MNTIRELKQQEKYKSMLKRKNKEKKIYKDKNASLQFEKQKLYRVLLNREQEIERLNNIIKELEKWLEVNLTNLEKEKANNTYDKGLKQGMLSNGRLIKNKLQELKGSDKEYE